MHARKALETADKVRKEQMALACMKRDSMKKASTLYIKHLESALNISPPELFKSILEKVSENMRTEIETGDAKDGEEVSKPLTSDSIEGFDAQVDDLDFQIPAWKEEA